MILLVLLNTLLPAIAIALAVWIALRIARVNAATRYWMWWGVIATVVALLLSALFSPVSSSETVAVAAPIEVEPGVNWFVWFALGWFGVALYRLVRIAVSYVRIRIICNRSQLADGVRLTALCTDYVVRRNARLLISDRIHSPIAVGFLRPAVIVPETMLSTLTQEDLDHVLLHELAHIARRDDWMNLAARIVGACLGLHPVVAFALTRIEKEREIACDDWVVAATGKARLYAATLTKVFELSRGQSSPGLASGITGSRLGDRIEQLLTHGRRFTRDASIAALILMSGVLAVMVLAASQSPGWVAFAQERDVPPVPPVPPAAPAAPKPPVPPAAPRLPAAPEPPAAPVTPAPPVPPAAAAFPNINFFELERNLALLRARQAEMRARQAQMQAEEDRLIVTEESLRARQSALKAELEAIQAQLEQLLGK